MFRDAYSVTNSPQSFNPDFCHAESIPRIVNRGAYSVITFCVKKRLRRLQRDNFEDKLSVKTFTAKFQRHFCHAVSIPRKVFLDAYSVTI